MLKIQKDNQTIELRNLQEQVQFLTQYHEENKGIAQWGIRVVGQVDKESDLPDPLTYQGEYGDAYAVGTEAPFYFYIWTRGANPTWPSYWFPFGEISIVGPQGPQGDKGDEGKSSKWYVFGSVPTGKGYNDGDMGIILNPNSSYFGQVYQFTKLSESVGNWISQANIRGPQGPQGAQGIQGIPGIDGEPGPKGEKGDVGGFINIVGIVANTEQLPTPESLDNLTYAYLVEHTGGTDAANDHYDLYIQVGMTSDEAMWENMGAFNAATLVLSGGEGQNVWDADTKLDKDTHVTDYNQVYVKAANGGQGHINVTKQVVNDAVVQRQSDGNILVPLVPAEDADAASKKYADTKLAISTTVTEHDQAYIKGATGTQFRKDVAVGVVGNALVERNGDGNIILPDEPSQDYDAISKGYADDNYLQIPTQSIPGASASVVGVGTDGKTTQRWITNPSYIFPANESNVIPMYREVGKAIINASNPPANTIYVAEPQLPYEAANKAYVDATADTKLTAKTGVTNYSQVYQKTANGYQSMINVTIHSEAGTLVERDGDGQVYVPYTPKQDNHAASKRYAGNVAKKYRHTIQVRLKNNTLGTDVRITLSLVSSRADMYNVQDFMAEFVNTVDVPTTFNGSMGDVYVNGVAEGAIINSEFTCNNGKMYVKWVTITPDGATEYHENTVDELQITSVFTPKEI